MGAKPWDPNQWGGGSGSPAASSPNVPAPPPLPPPTPPLNPNPQTNTGYQNTPPNNPYYQGQPNYGQNSAKTTFDGRTGDTGTTTGTPTGPSGQPYSPPKQGPPDVPPPTGFDPAWLSANIDSRISPEQWQAWQSFYDPAQAARDPKHPFKSENVDADGNPIQGYFEKPVDCPINTTKYGTNQCLPMTDPRIVAAQTGGSLGQQHLGEPPPPTAQGAQTDMSSIWAQLLPLLMSVYGGQAQGSYLPNTDTTLNSSLPFRG